MFSYIKGKIVSFEDSAVVLECGGIGYEILVSTNTLSKISDQTSITLFIYMQVKEDGITLYGFQNMQEKRMFLNLITVSGVGCKVSLAILSGLSLNDLAVSIANEDIAMLTKIKGIGKKTAERVILELKEKVGTLNITDTKPKEAAISFSKSADEAFEALQALGLKRNECLSAVQSAVGGGAKTVEEIIGYALKNLK